ncbi:hypothetical protein [Hymenobacter properus]|uniref:Uncharacterized protein n=1 Tax=Hymenobacter properus TaxID=2791026 RepID=A0A931FJS2_9BACT|nr:hypothetical protein [Hymenobacter properus]MBF9140865.1 hypothetical protein [Hymenobacter properus]MBR7719674.1 hypothetical protein [Microvirga sp. SRT04]
MITLPASITWFALWSLFGWSLLAFLLWLWLRHELTPARFLTIWESENVLSIRLVLATAVVLFTLCMQGAARISDAMATTNYGFAAVLLGLGTAKVVGKAFASRPATQINAPKSEIDAKNSTIKTGDTE